MADHKYKLANERKLYMDVHSNIIQYIRGYLAIINKYIYAFNLVLQA